MCMCYENSINIFSSSLLAALNVADCTSQLHRYRCNVRFNLKQVSLAPNIGIYKCISTIICFIFS